MKAKNYKQWYESVGREYHRQYVAKDRKHKMHIRITLFRQRCKGERDPNLTEKNLRKKFGENPCCYLTGMPVNLSDSSSYALDHIIPVSKGGKSSLENCGLTIPAVNFAKGNLTLEEFVSLCESVVVQQKGRVSPPNG